MIETVSWRRRVRKRSFLERLFCWPWRPFKQVYWVEYKRDGSE